MQEVSAKNILGRWPHIRDLAGDVGVAEVAVRRWMERGRIPGRHDLKIMESARKRGVFCSLEELAGTRSRRTIEAAE